MPANRARMPVEPLWDNLPPRMSPAEIAACFGVSTDLARRRANLHHYGDKLTRDGRTYYERAGVFAAWQKAFGQDVPETSAEPQDSAAPFRVLPEILAQTSQAASLQELTVAALQAIARNSDGETVKMLAEMVRAKDAEIERLRAELAGRTETANAPKRSWWERLLTRRG